MRFIIFTDKSVIEILTERIKLRSFKISVLNRSVKSLYSFKFLTTVTYLGTEFKEFLYQVIDNFLIILDLFV